MSNRPKELNATEMNLATDEFLSDKLAPWRQPRHSFAWHLKKAHVSVGKDVLELPKGRGRRLNAPSSSASEVREL